MDSTPIQQPRKSCAALLPGSFAYPASGKILMPVKMNGHHQNPSTYSLKAARKVARWLSRRTPPNASAIDEAVIRQSDLFDRDGYLRRYPDVATSGMDAVSHYVKYGAGEGRNPRDDFHTTFYVENNPDVATSGMNPFRHFVEFGHKEGRPTHSGCSGTGPVRRKLVIATEGAYVQTGSCGVSQSEITVIAQSGVFDPNYYLENNPQIANAGIDLIEHYVQYGAKEGRDPCALFNTKYYLENNPDVAKSGMNPLWHFCEFGRKEMRNPSAAFDMAWYWLTQLAELKGDENPLAHYMSRGREDALDIRAVDKFSSIDKKKLAEICERLQQRESYSATMAMCTGMAATRLSRWVDAEKAFRDAVALSWGDSKAHDSLARALAKQGKWWQVIDSLTVAISLEPGRASWYFRLGEAQEKMNRFDLAADAYRQAIELNPRFTSWHYHLGYAYEKSDRPDLAEKAYSEAIYRESRADVKKFGVGVLHQLRGYWSEAALAYEKLLVEEPLDAELYYRIGMAHDRCYRWEAASGAYRNAISLSPGVAYWHYRYGFVLERQELWCEAAIAYAAAAALSDKHMAYWHYRRAYCLDLAGRYEDACLAYFRTDPKVIAGTRIPDRSMGGLVPEECSLSLARYLSVFDSRPLIEGAIHQATTKADLHYKLGVYRELKGDWNGAAEAYASAVDRSNKHRPDWYFRLGTALYYCRRFKDASEAFRETRILRRAYGIDLSPYEKNFSIRQSIEYNEYFDTLQIRPKTVLYESYHGVTVSCNPFAIFKCLIDDPEFSDWTHIWVIKEGKSIPTEYASQDNVIFVVRGSDLYLRYMASSSYLINNNTFMPWFIRRPGQKYLNTWHGTPIKSLGKDIHDDFMAHKNAARNFLHATHILSPNRHTSDVLIRRNDIAGTFNGKIAETGYPRIDQLINATPELKTSMRDELELVDGSPVILYAPTWRGALGSAEIDIDRLIADVDALARLNCQVLFRGHHMTEKVLAEISLPVKVVPDHIRTCELLSIIDVLITDYSSIWFDFLPMRRPILYYAYDLDEYAENRGLYFDLQEMPGTLCRTRDVLLSSLVSLLENPRVDVEAYSEAIVRFCPHEDGGAATRAVEFFFKEDSRREVTCYRDDRRSLLMYAGGFIPNGVTASCLNLARGLDADRYRISIAIDPASVMKNNERLGKFYALPSDVQVLARVGDANWSPEQRWVNGVFTKRYLLYSPAMWSVYRQAYEREFLRMFGYGSFDCLVQFDGYINFWSSAFAFGSSYETERTIYLHNDMKGELETRFPWLLGNFKLYEYYDNLVSVSKSVGQANQSNLSESYRLPLDKFYFCNNLIDVAGILESSKSRLDEEISEWIGDAVLLGTLGRLSPEKGHRKLINAFYEACKQTDKKIKLVIAGDGDLRLELQTQIVELDLRDRVKLVGQLSNPYPLLKRMDLFIFSSDYEGQGIAILEALTLGKAVVSTDVVGPRTVLEDGYGLLVENSEEGLVDGMLEYLRGGILGFPFDAWGYQVAALRMFTDIMGKNAPIQASRQHEFADRFGRMVIAARRDGLGERLNAIVNGIYLAQKLGVEFRYSWKSMLSDTTHHAVTDEDCFFSQDFIARYSLKDFDPSGFVEVAGKHVDLDALSSMVEDERFQGWLAPRLDLRDVLAEGLQPKRGDLKEIFSKIEFSPTISAAIEVAMEAQLPDGVIALHLRGGDIFYGNYRKQVHFTYKCITLPVAKAIIEDIKKAGKTVLLFGQDVDVLGYLKKCSGTLLLSDLAVPEFDTASEQAIFEIVLMSRCDYIVAGSSGFPKFASWVGGSDIKLPTSYFTPEEQTSISLADLNLNGDEYNPLQTAFAYWYAYYIGRHAKSCDLIDSLLSKAFHYDPENQLYPIKRALNLYKYGRFMEGDSILSGVLASEYASTLSTSLPLFKVLTGRILGKYNLAEDLKYLDAAVEIGSPAGLICKLVLERAGGSSVAAAELGRRLSVLPDVPANLHGLRDALIASLIK